MKKSAVVVGAAVLVAVAYTGAAWYVGVQAEERIRTAVARTNERFVQTLGPDLKTLNAKIELRDYQRGVFSSKAHYTFIVQDGDDRYEFALRDRLLHGPFPWDLVKQGVFTPMLAHSRSQLDDTGTVRRWFDAARGAMPLEVDTRIGFRGDGVSVWQFAPLEWVADDENLSFSGGRVEVRFDNEFRDSTGDGQFASLIMGAQGQTVILKDIGVQSRTSSAPDKAFEVHSALQAASVSFADDGGEILSAQRVATTFDSKQTGSVVDAQLRYELQQVRMGELDLGSVSVGGRLDAFNYEAFTRLLSEYDAIAESHGAADGEDFELTPDDEAALLAALKPVLATSPRAAVGPVVWRNDKGESVLSLEAAFQPLKGNTPDEQTESLTEAVRELKLDVALSRPMILQAIAQMDGDPADQAQLQVFAAMMFDQYIGQLEREGLVRREGDKALATLVYSDNQVDVNQQRMSVEAFLMRYGSFFMF